MEPEGCGPNRGGSKRRGLKPIGAWHLAPSTRLSRSFFFLAHVFFRVCFLVRVFVFFSVFFFVFVFCFYCDLWRSSGSSFVKKVNCGTRT